MARFITVKLISRIVILLASVFFAFLPSLLTGAEPDQESRELCDLTIHSDVLGRDVSYSVYLPAGYSEESAPSFKILYLLHGLNGDNNTWFNGYKLKETVDPLIKDDPNKARIIVSPDAKRTWYVNSSSDGDQYEDFFVNELIPEIEKKFRPAPGRENRAISGLSMGGYGALHLAIRHPDLFSRCYAISASVRTDDQLSRIDNEVYVQKYGAIYGVNDPSQNRFTETYRKYDVLYQIGLIPENQLQEIKFTLDCGDDDALLEGNFEAFRAMRKRGIPVELRVRNGGHDRRYFNSALAPELEFLAEP